MGESAFQRMVNGTVAALLIVTMCFGGSAEAVEVEPLEIGAAAPDFALEGVDGQTYTLASFADAEVLVVLFTCNHCPTAQAYEERIIKLVDDYKNRGVELVAISPNDAEAVRLDELGYSDLGDTLEDMKIRARDHGFNFPYLYDGDTQEATMKYGPIATPHVFVFDKERKLRFEGRIDNNEDPRERTTDETRDAIDAVLAGRAVEVETTRVFGCSIKWSDKRADAVAALERWNAEAAELNDLDVAGVKALMKNETDNTLLINIWATWCGPCVTEFPHLVEINRMYRGRDFKMVTIAVNDDRDAAFKFLNKNAASMTNYFLTESDLDEFAEALDPAWRGAFPYTIIVKPGGEVVYRHSNAIDPLEVRREIVDQVSRFYFKLVEEE